MKYAAIILLSFFSFHAQAQSRAEATFVSKSLVLDSMIEGEVDTVVYHFTNTGGSDLVLYKANTTCGCTVASIPTRPIKPGESETIVATFNSSHKPGYNAKGINIDSNIGEINLVFQVKVIPNMNLKKEVEKAPPIDHSGHNH
ncbi:MAG: DUF1573 domain-containing protein [Bacteroidia bacterium]